MTRLALVLFLTLQLLVQAWSINFPMAQGECLGGALPPVAKVAIAQLDVDDDHREFEITAAACLAIPIQPILAVAAQRRSDKTVTFPHPINRPIYQQISVLLI